MNSEDKYKLIDEVLELLKEIMVSIWPSDIPDSLAWKIEKLIAEIEKDK